MKEESKEQKIKCVIVAAKEIFGSKKAEEWLDNYNIKINLKVIYSLEDAKKSGLKAIKRLKSKEK